MLKLKFQYFGNLMQRADSFEKTLMLGKIEGRRRRRAPLTHTHTTLAEMLEKTFARPLDCTEIQPVHPKGDQS